MKLLHLSLAFQVHIPLSARSRPRQRLAQTAFRLRGGKWDPSEWLQELIPAAENSPKFLASLDLWRQLMVMILNHPKGSAQPYETLWKRSSAGLMTESTVIQGPGSSQQELLGRMPLPKL